jgi:hypothetical protein
VPRKRCSQAAKSDVLHLASIKHLYVNVHPLIYTDGSKDFRSNHLQQIAVQLGFVCHLRVSEAAPKELRPSEGGIVERPFKTFNTELFSNLPG